MDHSVYMHIFIIGILYKNFISTEKQLLSCAFHWAIAQLLSVLINSYLMWLALKKHSSVLWPFSIIQGHGIYTN